MGNVVDLTATFESGNPSWTADIQIERPTDNEMQELEDIEENLRDGEEMSRELKDAILEIKDGNFEPIKDWLDEYKIELFEYLTDKALNADSGMFRVGEAWLANWRETLDLIKLVISAMCN